jgi:uncharacterized protein
MKLVDALLESIPDQETTIANLLIGLHWIALDSATTGVAHVFRGNQGFELSAAGNIIGKNAREITRLLHSWEPLEASLGLAAFNSLMQPRGEQVNVHEYIMSKAPGKTVTCVGRFPFYPELARTAARSYLLEMAPGEGELPPFAAEEVVPESNLVIITGTTLITKTMQRLLELTQRKSLVIILGPSTPLSEVLFDYGATVVAGIRVVDRELLYRSLAQGVKFYRNFAGIEPVTLFRT